MPIDLTQPIYPATPEHKRQTYTDLVQYGRIARMTGIEFNDCPPFIDEEMALSWRMGWRYEVEDEIAYAKRRGAYDEAARLREMLDRTL